MSLAQGSKQQGNDWSCHQRASVVAFARPYLQPQSAFHSLSHARTHTLAPVRRRNTGQISVAGNTYRNHQSPGGSRENQVRPDVRGTLPTSLAESGPGWRDINHAGPQRFGQGGQLQKGERAAASAGDGFLFSPGGRREGGTGEDPHLSGRRLVIRLSAGSGSRRIGATLGSWESYATKSGMSLSQSGF